jgi:hypothetical protein
MGRRLPEAKVTQQAQQRMKDSAYWVSSNSMPEGLIDFFHGPQKTST